VVVFIFLDLAFYIENLNDLGDNGLGLRTLQVDMTGKLNKNWFYRLKWGGFTNGGKLDSSDAYLDDAFIRYLGFDNIILTFGQHTEPFSLEQQTSSLNITFMERAFPSALTQGGSTNLQKKDEGE
jgi:phosphate-selective porin OprO/OprP